VLDTQDFHSGLCFSVCKGEKHVCQAFVFCLGVNATLVELVWQFSFEKIEKHFDGLEHFHFDIFCDVEIDVDSFI
jgi:hypothetical protein